MVAQWQRTRKLYIMSQVQVQLMSPFLLHLKLFILLGDLEKVEKSSKIQFESTQKITFFWTKYGNLRNFFRTFPYILRWGQLLKLLGRGTE
jgi:hypothetical protein